MTSHTVRFRYALTVSATQKSQTLSKSHWFSIFILFGLFLLHLNDIYLSNWTIIILFVFFIQRFPITHQSSQICHLLFQFSNIHVSFINYPWIDISFSIYSSLFWFHDVWYSRLALSLCLLRSFSQLIYLLNVELFFFLKLFVL